MEEAYLKELARIVESISPQLWDMGVQQAIKVGETHLFVALLFGGLAMLMVYLTVRGARNVTDFDYDGHKIAFPAFGLAICLLIGILCAIAASRHIGNPEYYAIQELFKMPGISVGY